MAEVMKKATRDSYGEALVELGQENPNIVVFDADLAGAGQVCQRCRGGQRRLF